MNRVTVEITASPEVIEAMIGTAVKAGNMVMVTPIPQKAIWSNGEKPE